MASKKQQRMAGLSLIAMVLFFISGIAYAETLTSSNFQIENPTISVGGGAASSASFQYSGALGEYMIGESSGVTFTDMTGFAYQGATTTPVSPSVLVVGPGSVLTPITTNAILSGVATPNAQITVVLEDNTYTAIADTEGYFSVTLRDIASGEHHVAVRATKPDGSHSVEQDIVFTVPNLSTAYVTGIDVSGISEEVIYDTLPMSPREPSVVHPDAVKKPSTIKIEIRPSEPLGTTTATSSQETTQELRRTMKWEIFSWAIFFATLAYYIVGRYKRRHKKHIFDEHFYR